MVAAVEQPPKRTHVRIEGVNHLVSLQAVERMLHGISELAVTNRGLFVALASIARGKKSSLSHGEEVAFGGTLLYHEDHKLLLAIMRKVVVGEKFRFEPDRMPIK